MKFLSLLQLIKIIALDDAHVESLFFLVLTSQFGLLPSFYSGDSHT